MSEFDYSLLSRGVLRWMATAMLSGQQFDMWHRPCRRPSITIVLRSYPVVFRGYPSKWVLRTFTWQRPNSITRIWVEDWNIGELWDLSFLGDGRPFVNEGTMSAQRKLRSVEVVAIAGTLRSALESELRGRPR